MQQDSSDESALALDLPASASATSFLPSSLHDCDARPSYKVKLKDAASSRCGDADGRSSPFLLPRCHELPLQHPRHLVGQRDELFVPLGRRLQRLASKCRRLRGDDLGYGDLDIQRGLDGPGPHGLGAALGWTHSRKLCHGRRCGDPEPKVRSVCPGEDRLQRDVSSGVRVRGGGEREREREEKETRDKGQETMDKRQDHANARQRETKIKRRR